MEWWKIKYCLARENGKVFPFKPEPKNFELLKKNVKINNYSNVILEKKTIGNKTGIKEIIESEAKKIGQYFLQ